MLWEVAGQGWNSRDGADWYPVEANAVVHVAGAIIEAQVEPQ